MHKKKIIKTLITIVTDLVMAGLLLCIFALFHHVIPQKRSTENAIFIPKPTTSATGFQLPEATATDQLSVSEKTSAPEKTPTPQKTREPERTSESEITVAPTATIASTPTKEPIVPIQTENSYRSNNVLVNMKTVQVGSGRSKVTYHVADIYITNVECFRSAFAENTYGDNFAQNVLEQDIDNDAIVAISGDSYGMSDSGIVLRNGILYRYDNTSADICVLYYDGTMKTLSPGEYTKESLIADGAYQVWNFGPGLLDDNGKAKTRFNAEDYITKAHPRAAIGYYDPGHYVFVLVDGRQNGYSKGLNISDLAELFEELGCKAAYNLDGGISAVMTFNDNIYSHPDKTREVTDILYIGEL